MMEGILKLIASVLLVTLLCFLRWWLIQLMWNAIMPTIFDLPTISFGQAIILQVLVGLVIGRLNFKKN